MCSEEEMELGGEGRAAGVCVPRHPCTPPSSSCERSSAHASCLSQTGGWRVLNWCHLQLKRSQAGYNFLHWYLLGYSCWESHKAPVLSDQQTRRELHGISMPKKGVLQRLPKASINNFN